MPGINIHKEYLQYTGKERNVKNIDFYLHQLFDLYQNFMNSRHPRQNFDPRQNFMDPNLPRDPRDPRSLADSLQSYCRTTVVDLVNCTVSFSIAKSLV